MTKQAPLSHRSFCVCLLTLGSLLSALSAKPQPPLEDLTDYPVMGDWVGQWTNPTNGHEKDHPEMGVQLLPMGKGLYRVLVLPELYNRAEPYADLTGKWDGQSLRVDSPPWRMVFEKGKVTRGSGKLNGRPCEFEVKQAVWAPATLGALPPAGAKVLFDGSDTGQWQSEDGKPCHWNIVDGVLETESFFWDPKVPKDQRTKGSILTKEQFGSLLFHMEFRYPVEEEKRGQQRGNSGLFFHGIGELQILNSYTTVGWWDEAGSIYKRHPAKVNAAGPPLMWQTYDVEIDFIGNGKAVLTAKLNGRTVHNRLELPCDEDKVSIGLQDHINRLQFRNIWVLEKEN